MYKQCVDFFSDEPTIVTIISFTLTGLKIKQSMQWLCKGKCRCKKKLLAIPLWISDKTRAVFGIVFSVLVEVLLFFRFLLLAYVIFIVRDKYQIELLCEARWRLKKNTQCTEKKGEIKGLTKRKRLTIPPTGETEGYLRFFFVFFRFQGLNDLAASSFLAISGTPIDCGAWIGV